MVFVKLQPYVQSSVANRSCPKQSLKFFGPYKIIEKIGSAAYKLELPPHAQIHLVFHCSLLKASVPDFTLVFSDISTLPSLDVLVGCSTRIRFKQKTSQERWLGHHSSIGQVEWVIFGDGDLGGLLCPQGEVSCCTSLGSRWYSKGRPCHTCVVQVQLGARRNLGADPLPSA